MLSEISIRQFQEWRAYADLEPFDEERADLRAAQVVQTLRNLHRGRGRRAVTLQECQLHFIDGTNLPPSKTPAQSREQIRRAMDVIVAIFNAPKPKRRRRER